MSPNSLDDVSESFKTFGAADYGVFVFMLAVCSFIGLYFGYQDHQKHKKTKLKSRRGSEALDYLLGGKNVQVFPGSKKLIRENKSLPKNYSSGDVSRGNVCVWNNIVGNKH